MIKCFATTNSFQINAQGKISPCCKFKSTFDLFKEYNSVEKIFTDTRLVNLVTQHTRGAWTEDCYRCNQDEVIGKQSRRQMYDVIGLGKQDFMLDVSLGNYCNLKCRMCNPENSTQWYTDHAALVDQGLSTKKNFTTYLISDIEITALCNFLETIVGRVVIEVKGGEPLTMPNSEHFFKSLSRCKNSSNFEIWIATNGTKIPNWFTNTISIFKSVEISVSVDGTHQVYSYIRGGKNDSYNEVLTNAKAISLIRNVKLRFNVVVQNLNIQNLAELYTDLFAITNSHENITLIILRSPEYYQINIIPEELKNSTLDKLTNSLVCQNHSFKAICSLLLTPIDKKLWDKFLLISYALDKRRKQNIGVIFNV